MEMTSQLTRVFYRAPSILTRYQSTGPRTWHSNYCKRMRLPFNARLLKVTTEQHWILSELSHGHSGRADRKLRDGFHPFQLSGGPRGLTIAIRRGIYMRPCCSWLNGRKTGGGRLGGFIVRQVLDKRPVSTAAPLSATSKATKAFSSTLLLPKTTFPLKHQQPHLIEEQYRQRTCDELYRWQVNDSRKFPCVFSCVQFRPPTMEVAFSSYMMVHRMPTVICTWVRFVPLAQYAQSYRVRPCLEQNLERHHQSLQGFPRAQSPVS